MSTNNTNTTNNASHKAPAAPAAPSYIQITSLPLATGAMPTHFAISVPEVACAWGMQDCEECSVLLQELLQAEGYRWSDPDTPAGKCYSNARYLYVSNGELMYGTRHATYLTEISGYYSTQHTGICMDYLTEKYVREYLESRAEYVQE